MFDSKTILVTGGTGSFGKFFVKDVLEAWNPKKIIVFSRDEWKQHEMRCAGFADERIRYFIGDVRDEKRLYRALNGVDIVIHAAAMKQVPACEYNPFEAVKTNILGAQNLINAAIRRRVKKVLALSSDKAVNPINIYGATKLCAEKLFIAANRYSAGKTLFSAVRYGNVIGSRGSVIPLFLEQAKTGKVTVTDPKMTRFWLTLDSAAFLVLIALRDMVGGEIFVPKLDSMEMGKLAEAVAPGCEVEIIGIRPGEKIHETLISREEATRTAAYPSHFVIKEKLDDNDEPFWGESYSSDTCPSILEVKRLRRILNGPAG